MKEDLAKMKEKNSSKIIIFADKTRNYYKCDLQQYEKLVTENISKEYRKANGNELKQLNMEAVKIAKNKKLENKMEIFTPGEAYLAIKDHKPVFPRKISCRLINPAKTDVGKLSRIILQEKVTELRDKLKFNQWKSTNEVQVWFSSLKYTKEAIKNQKIEFIKFDMEACYPSISRDLLNKSIQFP